MIYGGFEVIDVHAHVFPDKIAEKAVDTIGRYYNITMAGSGTVDGLLKSGGRAGVLKYIIHSSATVVEQVMSINDFLHGVQASNGNIAAFGTLHPDFPEFEWEIDRIISLGLKGVKLHPDFQGFDIDDPRMLPVYGALEGRLPVLVHMGDENKTSSRPSRLARILDMFPGLVVIAAHFGGYRMWEESSEYLIGRNLYMDTSSSLPFLDRSEAVSMIRRHGADKMLFGTDYPMWDHTGELERFLRLDLTAAERRAILFENVSRLIG